MNTKRPFKHYSGIPTDFLLQMGNYDIKIDGVKIKTHVIDCAEGVDKHVAEMCSRLECGPKVVGIDYRRLMPPYSHRVILILYALGQCLIIHLDRVGTPLNAPESLDNFLSDLKICFVGITLPAFIANGPKFSHNNIAVKVGELAARVLKKPELASLTLGDIAKEVGVEYKSRASSATELQADLKNLDVFTEENVVAAISDAFAYYQIGFKLLTSL